MKVLVRGPVLTRTGYGEHVRFLLRSLKTVEEHIDIYIIPVGWGQTGWDVQSDEEREWIDGLIAKTQAALLQQVQFDMTIQVSIPNEWEKLAPINIGVTAGIETTKVAPQWVEKANIMDSIIVPSEHSKYVFENSTYSVTIKETGQVVPDYKCTKPIKVISYPVKDYPSCELDLDFETDFNFLNVAQWGPRKNLDNCIKWFVEEFYDQEVGFVLKTNLAKNSLIDRNWCQSKITNLLSEEKYKDRKCKIYLLHGDMTEQELHQLYRHPKIKALITTSHGEGFGLPMFEASYEGTPVIAPDWSGYTDFMHMPIKDKKGKVKNKPKFCKVDFSLLDVQKEAVWDGVIQADSKWAFADQGSFKMKLREVHKDYGRFKKQAKELQAYNKENLSAQKQYSAFVDAIFPNKDEWITDEDFDELFDDLVG